MHNFYESQLDGPDYLRILQCGDTLITYFDCPLIDKFSGLWSQHNYIVYVTEGRKVWHSAHQSISLEKGSCVFVRKGASIVEQFFDSPFCLVLFFIPDEFIYETLKSRSKKLFS